jgi:hypothetical protein
MRRPRPGTAAGPRAGVLPRNGNRSRGDRMPKLPGAIVSTAQPSSGAAGPSGLRPSALRAFAPHPSAPRRRIG